MDFAIVVTWVSEHSFAAFDATALRYAVAVGMLILYVVSKCFTSNWRVSYGVGGFPALMRT